MAVVNIREDTNTKYTAEVRDEKHKYGVSGFVDVTSSQDCAFKYSEFNEFLWVQEYAVLTYLWKFDNDNIIQYKNGIFMPYNRPDAHGSHCDYLRMTFKKYPRVLADTSIYRDEELCQIMLDVLSALDFLHRSKIIHRDIKPDNIMLTEDNRAVLIDFSHSHKETTKFYKQELRVYSSWYRPPEVFKCRAMPVGEKYSYDYFADMWAIGMVFAEVLTGKAFWPHEQKNGERSEATIANMLLHRYSDFETNFFAFVKENARPFKHIDTYIAWLNALIRPLPEGRYTAGEMYRVVKEFVDLNGIAHVVPVNGRLRYTELLPIAKIEDALNLFEDADYKLLESCIQSLKKDQFASGENMHIGAIKQCLAYMICKKIITLENFVEYSLAISMIIKVVVFDGAVISLDVLLNKDAANKTYSAIRNIITNYGIELFMHEVFDFRNGDKPFEEI